MSTCAYCGTMRDSVAAECPTCGAREIVTEKPVTTKLPKPMLIKDTA